MLPTGFRSTPPFQLLDDLDEGRIELSQAVRMMELIYESFLDKLDLYIEYNTTTTQSDYGELFYYRTLPSGSWPRSESSPPGPCS